MKTQLKARAWIICLFSALLLRTVIEEHNVFQIVMWSICTFMWLVLATKETFLDD